MRMRNRGILLAVLGGWCAAGVARADGVCTPPAGFKDTPHPVVAPVDQLVSHTEEVVIAKPLDAVLAEAERTDLNQAIKKADTLPGVAGTRVLTDGDFGEPGSRRLVCLTDWTTTEEQVLERSRTKTQAKFRYVVWNYTTEKARPVLYGVGEFVHTDLGDGRTRVRWTYSFQLRRDVFPGYLGGLGDWLFRVTFLDREYAQMMRRTLAGHE
jgi:hypothetical protein